MMTRIMMAYIPVMHAGYLKLFQKYEHHVECLYVLGEDFIAEDRLVAREIRALKPEVVVQLVRALNIFPSVQVLDKQALFLLKQIRDKSIIVPNDELSLTFAEANLPRKQLVIETAFLRWDRKTVKSSSVPVAFDRCSSSSFDRDMMHRARQEGEKTSCWWRRVGGVVVRNGEVIMQAHNEHMPTEHAPYVVGDPRDVLQPGTDPDLASSLHAEQAIVAVAAREGISLTGTHLYLSVFPCMVCAKLIANSGISKLFFASGCAYLDGETILRSRGVEIILVS